MNILVTGGTGFIGREFVPKLIEKGHNVTLVIRNIEKAKKIFANKVNYIVSDITDNEHLEGCCNNIDIVYHMVAKTGNDILNQKNLDNFRKINVEGTRNIMLQAKKSKVKKFIFVSSIAAMGIVKANPIREDSTINLYLPYQITKHEAEELLLKEFKDTGFPVIILRPTKVYGIGEPEYSNLSIFKLLKHGINLRIGLTDNSISNIWVGDLVEALLNCIDNGILGNSYILSGKDSISCKEISNLYTKLSGKKVCNIFIPEFLMKIIAFIEERVFLLLHKKPIITYQNVCSMATSRIYDLSKANEQLNFNPVYGMKDGLAMMYEWYKSEGML